MAARARALPKRLSREEVARLLAQPNARYPTGVRDRALLRLFYRAGLRCNEALNLRVRDVDFRRLEVRVNDGKGGKDRVVWLDEVSCEVLRAWRDRRPRSEFFFCTLQGNRVHDSHVRHMVARRAKKAGIELRVHPHMLRHTYASELLEEGFSVSEVQKLLGHEDLQTTSIYLHVVDGQLAEKLKGRR